jgi:hypothetical protein
MKTIVTNALIRPTTTMTSPQNLPREEPPPEEEPEAELEVGAAQQVIEPREDNLRVNQLPNYLQSRNLAKATPKLRNKIRRLNKMVMKPRGKILKEPRTFKQNIKSTKIMTSLILSERVLLLYNLRLKIGSMFTKAREKTMKMPRAKRSLN